MSTSSKPRVTLRDIARLAGVSVASVSLALRDSPRISKGRRAHISGICDQVGYVRDGRLSQLMSHLRAIDHKDSDAALAAVVTHPDSGGPGYVATKTALLAAMRGEAAKQGYSLDVFDLVAEGISPKRLRQILSARGISGVLVLPSDDQRAFSGFDYSSFCVVGVGYELDAPAPHRVCANYLKMMDELMRFALARGHRKIGLIPEPAQSLLKNRMLSSSIDYHLARTPGAGRLRVFAGNVEDDGELRGWLRRERPDLVLGCRKTYERLIASGYRLPEDFSFASWDVVGMPGKVAGLDHRPDLIGAEAVRLVVDGINRNELGLPVSPGITVVDSGFRVGATLGRMREDVSFETPLMEMAM